MFGIDSIFGWERADCGWHRLNAYYLCAAQSKYALYLDVLTFQRDHSAARQIRLVAHQNDGALRNVIGRPQRLNDALRIDETLAIRRRVDDTVAVRIVAGQAVLRLHTIAKCVSELQLGSPDDVRWLPTAVGVHLPKFPSTDDRWTPARTLRRSAAPTPISRQIHHLCTNNPETKSHINYNRYFDRTTTRRACE